MARFFYAALIVCVAAMYMAYAAPNPQQTPPLTPPGGLPVTPPPEGADALTPPPGSIEAPANNYTGGQPHNCTEFVQKCTTLTTNQQYTAGAGAVAGSLGPIGSGYNSISKYDCAAASKSCNGTAPPTVAPPAFPGAPSAAPGRHGFSLFNL